MSKSKKVSIAGERDLRKEMAMDIGKEVVSQAEQMYPQAFLAASSTFRLHLRNSIYNEIVAAMSITEEREVAAWLDRRKKHRRKITAMHKAISETDWGHYRAKRAGSHGG